MYGGFEIMMSNWPMFLGRCLKMSLRLNWTSGAWRGVSSIAEE